MISYLKYSKILTDGFLARSEGDEVVTSLRGDSTCSLVNSNFVSAKAFLIAFPAVESPQEVKFRFHARLVRNKINL